MSDPIEELVPAKPFFRIDEVAELLCVHHNTVRAWINDGKVDHVRLATGGIRVPRPALVQFLGAYRSITRPR